MTAVRAIGPTFLQQKQEFHSGSSGGMPQSVRCDLWPVSGFYCRECVPVARDNDVLYYTSHIGKGLFLFEQENLD